MIFKLPQELVIFGFSSIFFHPSLASYGSLSREHHICLTLPVNGELNIRLLPSWLYLSLFAHPYGGEIPKPSDQIHRTGYKGELQDIPRHTHGQQPELLFSFLLRFTDARHGHCL
jgi:hypothetical protein